MRGHYQNKRLFGRSTHLGAIPEARGRTSRQYQKDLNQEADLLFWSETHYKHGQRLDPRDPADQHMVPAWLDARARIARSMTPQALRQNAAARAAFDESTRTGLPYYVYSRGGATDEQLVPFADKGRAFSYAHARVADSDYVAYFDTADPRWPSPAFEASPRTLA
jgi:hypothetical protein